MGKQSIQRWLIQTGAAVCAITIVCALGAAVFAALCGSLGWMLRVEKVPIGFFWATTSGGIAGFLMGILWAIDRALNWQHSLSPSPYNALSSAMPSENGEALEKTARNKLSSAMPSENGTMHSPPPPCPPRTVKRLRKPP